MPAGTTWMRSRDSCRVPQCRPLAMPAGTTWMRSPLAGQGQRGVDQANMGERLGVVAQGLPGVWLELLGQQPDIVGCREQGLEILGCATFISSERAAFDVPEAANAERPLRSRRP